MYQKLQNAWWSGDVQQTELETFAAEMLDIEKQIVVDLIKNEK